MAGIIAELAVHEGYDLILSAPGVSAEGNPEVALPVPEAFTTATPISGVEVPAEQFTHMEPLLGEGLYVVDGAELTTDAEKVVRVVDLRPQVAGVLGDIVPDAAETERLESHFYRDLRVYIDNGWARNAVRRNTGMSGPFYSRYVGAKSRTYWGPVRVVERDGNHVLTVARFAHNGNDPNKEVKLYRRLFGMTLRHIN
ncbi:MAG TPA: hypothetical protein VLF62_01165 [Candidatus Saccharimonadales bacterium]|nr:hypothetical protein [Candidatus Saccharimonadales bacterium]